MYERRTVRQALQPRNGPQITEAFTDNMLYLPVTL